MGRKPRGVKGYTPEQIKELFRSDEKYKIGLRLYAVYQVALGKPSRELETLYNTSYKQILNWVERFEKHGVDGLRDKSRQGRTPRLTPKQMQRLKELLDAESPTEHGYNTHRWTGPLLIDWIDREFGVRFKKAHIYNLIAKLGFSYQKARGIYPEADPAEQQAFKESLKKTPPGP
jgi:transposase